MACLVVISVSFLSIRTTSKFIDVLAAMSKFAVSARAEYMTSTLISSTFSGVQRLSVRICAEWER